MRTRVGYELVYECPQSTPMLLMLNTHYSRAQDMVAADQINTQPWVPLRQYQDSFGNLCTRLTAPFGLLTLSARGVFEVPPVHEAPGSNSYQHAISDFVHNHVRFDYNCARPTKTAWQTW